MNKTEDNALNKRLAELLGWKWGGCLLRYNEHYRVVEIHEKASHLAFTYNTNFTPTTDKAQAFELLELLQEKSLSVIILSTKDTSIVTRVYNDSEGKRQSTSSEYFTLEETITRAVIKLLESENG